MSEDFIIEEEGSEGTSNRRPFFIAVGVLSVTLLLAAICAGSALLNRNGDGGGGNDAAVQTRIAENDMIAVTNTAVAITIEAMTVEAMTREAMPTETLVPTNTPLPTATPLPTNTPVVAQAEETEEPEIEGTSEFVVSGGNTPTPIALAGGSGSGSGTGGGGDTLPDTGFESVWVPLLAALVLIGLVLTARRLRSS